MNKSEILKKMLAVGLSVMSCMPAVGATGNSNEDPLKVQIKKESKESSSFIKKALIGSIITVLTGLGLYKFFSSENTEKHDNEEPKPKESDTQNQNSGNPEQAEVNTTTDKKPEPKESNTQNQNSGNPAKAEVNTTTNEKPEKKDAPSQDKKEFEVTLEGGAGVCLAYFSKPLRNFIKGLPKGDAFVDAMKYMFEVFEGRETPDSINIKKDLSTISYCVKEKKDEIKHLFEKFGGGFRNDDNNLDLPYTENADISIAEKIKDLTGSEIYISLKAGKGRIYLEPALKFFREASNIVLKVKDFDNITNAKNEEYELGIVINFVEGSEFMAVKNESGKWIVCQNESIKEVPQEDIMEIASSTDEEMYLGYIKK